MQVENRTVLITMNALRRSAARLLYAYIQIYVFKARSYIRTPVISILNAIQDVAMTIYVLISQHVTKNA